ncbi:MAG: ATP-dependent Clp protease ATP-binding subunit ClpA, partial [Candidatus Binatia bacterium]
KGYSQDYGARPMRRAVEKHLEDPLAEELLNGNLQDNGSVKVTLKDGKLSFAQKAPRKKPVSK